LPLYPYRCTQCGHRFEKIQHFKDEPIKVCPKCAGAVERLLTAPGLQFKGAGWYVNDYAPKSGGAGGESAPAEKKPVGESKAEATKADAASAGSSGKAEAASSAPAPAPSAKKD